MLEAVQADLVSPSAWSAAPKIFSYPQAAGRLPHLFPQFPTYRCGAPLGDQSAEPRWDTPHGGELRQAAGVAAAGRFTARGARRSTSRTLRARVV